MSLSLFRRSAAAAVRAGVAIAAAMLVGGCASAPEPRFYSLTPSPNASSAESGSTALKPEPRQSGALVVAIGAIGLPDQVDRPQIVTIFVDQRGVQHLDMSEEHRWAASLQSQIAQVLSEKLAQMLATPYVTAYPQGEAQNPDVRISINVQRFDAQLGSDAVVDAIWFARDTATGQQRGGHTLARARIERSADVYQAVVAAYRAGIDQIAEEVAEAVRSLNATHQQNR